MGAYLSLLAEQKWHPEQTIDEYWARERARDNVKYSLYVIGFF